MAHREGRERSTVGEAGDQIKSVAVKVPNGLRYA
jgi:hypothetical protein